MLIALELEICGLASPVGWHLLKENTGSTPSGGHRRLPTVKISFRKSMEVRLRAQMVKPEPTADVNAPGTGLNEKTIPILVLVVDSRFKGRCSLGGFTPSLLLTLLLLLHIGRQASSSQHKVGKIASAS